MIPYAYMKSDTVNIEPFVMSGTTLATGTPQITLGYLEPYANRASFTINWGDGTSSTYTSAVNDLSINHVYPSNSTDYTITITQAQMIDSFFCDWTDTNNLWIDSVDSWGIDFVQDKMSFCFYYCSSLVSIPNSWEGLNGVLGMYQAFDHCTSLTTMPTTWEGLDSCISIFGCFSTCYNLTAMPTTWEGLENVTNIESSFRECTNLTTMPTTWEGLENATNMSFCFYECTNITAIAITSLSSLSNVTTCAYAFSLMDAVTSDILPIYNQLVTSAVYFDGCFTGVTNAINYSSIPSDWK